MLSYLYTCISCQLQGVLKELLDCRENINWDSLHLQLVYYSLTDRSIRCCHNMTIIDDKGMTEYCKKA